MLKLLKGADPRSINKDEPMVKRNLRDAPSWMSPTQCRIWDENIADCPSGMLKGPDGGVFGAYCAALVECVDLELEIRKLKSRLYKTTKGNLIQHPYIGMLNRKTLIMRTLASELGFTPTSRTRIKVQKGGGEENPFSGNNPNRPNSA